MRSYGKAHGVRTAQYNAGAKNGCWKIESVCKIPELKIVHIRALSLPRCYISISTMIRLSRSAGQLAGSRAETSM
jgi:hypothetical protein